MAASITGASRASHMMVEFCMHVSIIARACQVMIGRGGSGDMLVANTRSSCLKNCLKWPLKLWPGRTAEKQTGTDEQDKRKG